MTVLAWTGSRPPLGGFTDMERGLVLLQIPIAVQMREAIVLTGGCIGLDEEITLAAQEYHLPTRAMLPYNGVGTTAFSVLRKCSTVVVETGVGYTERDQMIVDEADEVRAIGLHEPRRLPRAGTWATARMAQRAGKLASIIVLRPADGGPPRKYEVGAEWCLCPFACKCGLKQLESLYA